MSCSLRRAVRAAAGALAVIGSAVVLTTGPATLAAAEPRPFHAGSVRPDVMLTTAPAVLSCTVRAGQHGCTSFAPDEAGVLAAILYSEPWFGGARLYVYLATDGSGCSARTSDDEGGGDLAGPLVALLGEVRSVETFHRCDVRLRDGFLGADAATTGWVHEDRDLSGLVTAAFTVT